MSEDRTSEFLSLVESLSDTYLPNRGINSNDMNGRGAMGRQATPLLGSRSNGTSSIGIKSSSNPTKNAAYEQLRNFHSTASEISRDIAGTSAMLSELSQLVRRRGLFMDDTERVNYLVLRIKSNIEHLNGQLDDVGHLIAQQKRRLGKNSQAGQEASNLVGQLKEEFVQTTSNFKNVLQQRSDRMKEQNDRKRQVFGQGQALRGLGQNSGDDSIGLLALGSKPPVYQKQGSADTQSSGPGSFDATIPKLDLTSGLENLTMQPGESSSGLPRPRGVNPDPYSTNSYSFNDNSSLRLRRGTSDPSQQPHILTPLEMQRIEQESGTQALQLIPDQNYLRERADAMTTVESHIVELGTIFNKLAVMVSEHREMVQRVEDNVEDATDNFNLSMQALASTLENLRTNKQLFMKILTVFIVFIILFITFFA